MGADSQPVALTGGLKSQYRADAQQIPAHDDVLLTFLTSLHPKDPRNEGRPKLSLEIFTRSGANCAASLVPLSATETLHPAGTAILRCVQRHDRYWRSFARRIRWRRARRQ